MRGTCDQVRARVAIELRVLKSTCVPFAIQLCICEYLGETGVTCMKFKY